VNTFRNDIAIPREMNCESSKNVISTVI